MGAGKNESVFWLAQKQMVTQNYLVEILPGSLISLVIQSDKMSCEAVIHLIIQFIFAKTELLDQLAVPLKSYFGETIQLNSIFDAVQLVGQLASEANENNLRAQSMKEQRNFLWKQLDALDQKDKKDEVVRRPAYIIYLKLNVLFYIITALQQIFRKSDVHVMFDSSIFPNVSTGRLHHSSRRLIRLDLIHPTALLMCRCPLLFPMYFHLSKVASKHGNVVGQKNSQLMLY